MEKVTPELILELIKNRELYGGNPGLLREDDGSLSLAGSGAADEAAEYNLFVLVRCHVLDELQGTYVTSLTYGQAKALADQVNEREPAERELWASGDRDF